MRILLDENLPAGLAILLAGHQVDSVTGAGWAGIQNGKLLQLADQNYDAFLTMDRNFLRSDNAETDFVATNFHDGDGDVIVDDNALVLLT